MLKREKLSINEALCATLLALILSLNAVSTVFPAYRTVLTYSIFGLFIVITIFTTCKHLKFRVNWPITVTVLLYLLWSFITMELHNTGAEAQYVKFILCLIVASMAATLNRQTRMVAIRISILISTLFAVYTILRYDRIYRTVIYSQAGSGLTITLPISFGLMLALIEILLNRGKKLKIIAYFVSVIIQTVALLAFSARSNLIFPYIVFIILLLLDSRNNRRAVIRNIILLVIGIILFYYLFSRFANAKMVLRLTRLFTQYEDEPRVLLYRTYIKDIIENTRWLLGSGFGRSAEIIHSAGLRHNYPHNLILEFIGEGGIFGISLVITTTVELIRAERFHVSNLNEIEWNMNAFATQAFFLINGGFLFYLFSFFKSYSIYDGYQLFIFIGMILFTGSRQETTMNTSKATT